MAPKVGCIEIDHIGQHRVPAFFGVEREQLVDVSGFVKRVDEIFGAVTPINQVDGGAEAISLVRTWGTVSDCAVE